MLHKGGMTNVKPTTKPGLTTAMRMIRLEWALAHQKHTYLQPQRPITGYSLDAPEKMDGWESDTENDLHQGDLDESESD